jgi:hypothetical protein
MKRLILSLPLLAGVLALMSFSTPAHAYGGAQCYETFNLGGNFTIRYATACPRNVHIVQSTGPVHYYQAANGRVTVVQPAYQPYYKQHYYKPVKSYHYRHGEDWGRHGRHDDRRHHGHKGHDHD